MYVANDDGVMTFAMSLSECKYLIAMAATALQQGLFKGEEGRGVMRRIEDAYFLMSEEELMKLTMDEEAQHGHTLEELEDIERQARAMIRESFQRRKGIQ